VAHGLAAANAGNATTTVVERRLDDLGTENSAIRSVGGGPAEAG
jgi:hypothetical protein